MLESNRFNLKRLRSKRRRPPLIALPRASLPGLTRLRARLRLAALHRACPAKTDSGFCEKDMLNQVVRPLGGEGPATPGRASAQPRAKSLRSPQVGIDARFRPAYDDVATVAAVTIRTQGGLW